MVFMKKSTTFRHKRYHGCFVMKPCIIIIFVIQAFVLQLAIANNYDKIVLKIFINTIAKPHVKDYVTIV